MIGTEQEAREWWCPMARSQIHLAAGNRDAATGEMLLACRCLASKCAMWRWLSPADFSRSWKEGDEKRGYCGLGGKP